MVLTKVHYCVCVALICGVVVWLRACTSMPSHPLYTPSPVVLSCGQSTFEAYVEETQTYLETYRVCVTADAAQEIESVMPAQYTAQKPERPVRAVLLVHGFTDSPAYMTDVARALAEKGFLVRTLLLPGHGSRPADLHTVTLEAWQACVKQQTGILLREVDEVWLGGLSMGGNLVTLQALDDTRVAGLLLFAPAFDTQERFVSLAPLARYVTDWAITKPSTGNPMRYDAFSMNGVAQYYRSAQRVQNALRDTPYAKPTLILISEHDNTVPAPRIQDMFSTSFTHPQSRMVVFGQAKASDDARVQSLRVCAPAEGSQALSHVGLMFSPEHPLYGRGAKFARRADHEDALPERRWSLMWNPHFDEMMTRVVSFMQASGVK